MLKIAHARAAISRWDGDAKKSILSQNLPKFPQSFPTILMVNFLGEWGQLLLGKSKDHFTKLKMKNNFFFCIFEFLMFFSFVPFYM
jgi:hypothetical protein